VKEVPPVEAGVGRDMGPEVGELVEVMVGDRAKIITILFFMILVMV
jgi:hypothetical protein